MAISPVMFSSKNQRFNTPPQVVERLREFDERGVWLDPCSNETSIVGAHHEYRLELGQDGLVLPWSSDHGPCFWNPPYDDLVTWAPKAVREATERDVESIGLIPARTDTEAFQDFIFPFATAICFWKGRLSFGWGPCFTRQLEMFAAPEAPPELEKKNDGAPFPSCLPYFGTRPQRFKRAFEPVGAVHVLR